ncbi:unnamed protein product [Heterobilharzia americana]|nr:unnamed protein product [Heterobilharzia americana]
MLLHRNQHEIIMGTNKGEVIVWDLRNNAANSIYTDSQNQPIHSLSLDQEVTSLAAVNSDGQLIVWSLSADTAWKPMEKNRQKVHPTYAIKVQFSPDSTLIATGGGDGKFNILKTADFSLVTSRKGSVSGHHWVWDCAFSADSRFLLTATSDGVARLWNLETNEVPVEYKGHQRAVTCMAFRDHSLKSKEINSVENRQKVHPTYAIKVQFSPDSTLIATGGGDGKFNILKTADFSLVTSRKGSVSGHHWVWDCAFSADSRFLLTATSDGVARLWNLETNEVPVEYKGHQRAVTCMAFRDHSLKSV